MRGGRFNSRVVCVGGALLVALCLASAVSAESWPQWRGPGRNGVTSEQSGWNGSSWNIEKKWQTSVGSGFGASPILVNGRVYVMGNVAGSSERISCLSVSNNGAVVWYQEYAQGVNPRYWRGDSPEGPASTPTFDPETSYLYTLGIDGDLNCWDAGDPAGTNIWHINLYDTYGIDQRNSGCSTDPTRDYGYCGSPLLMGGLLVVEVGDETDGNIMAFNKMSGTRVWASEDKHDAGHNCGPVLMDLEGTPCIASFTLQGMRVMRADTGHEGENVAWYDWLMPFNVNCPTPAVSGNTVVLTSTADNGSGKKTTFLQVSLTGGITNQWQGQRQAYICSPVIHAGYVYMVDIGLSCIEFSTGNFVWQGGMSLYSGNNGSLLITGDDKVLAWGNNTLILAETAKNSPGNYVELAKITSAIAGGHSDCHPHVAMADGWIVVKDKTGNIAGYSRTAADTTAPAISMVGAGTSNEVVVVFDEDLEEMSAEAAGNYAVNHGVTVSGAALGADLRTVTLTCSVLTEGLTYVLTVNNVRDRADTPNAIAPNSVVAFEYVTGAVLDGLAAHWPMEEGAGVTTADCSGGGHDGAINGAVWTDSGKYGKALDFDGTDDYVDAGKWSVGGTGLTITAWFKADDFGVTDARIFSKATGTAEQDHYWMLSTTDSGGMKLRFRLKAGGSTQTLVANGGTLTPGEWAHAAVVYDGAVMTIYKDAVGVGSTPKTGALDTDDNVSVWIGNNPGGMPFDGVIDDVRVYGRALSVPELEMVMQGREYRCVDSDGDGMADDWENEHFGSTTNILGDAWADYDGDGLCNFFESQAGTDPTNALSVLDLAAVEGQPGGEVVLRWHSASGRLYRIVSGTNLTAGLPELLSAGIPAAPPLNARTVTVDHANWRFYRVRLE